MDKAQLYDLLQSQGLMVLSTLSKEGKPQSAVVGFAQTKSLELILGTLPTTRKAHNLTKNGTVSVVVGWGGWTIQIEGIARRLNSDETAHYRELFLVKNPMARNFADEPQRLYFLITPTWLRHTDITKSPWEVNEIQFPR